MSDNVGTFFFSQALNRSHKNTLGIINKNFEHFSELGYLEIRKLQSTGGRPVEEYVLNYDQLLLLTSMLRNNEYSIKIKKTLIKTAELSKAFEMIKRFDSDDIQCRYVYAAMDERGRVKIGISNDPEKRIKTLNIGNADQLSLIFSKKAENNGYQDEVYLHNKCEKFHIRSEWYKKEVKEVLK